MATKTLNTRISLKTDTTANWGASTLVLLKGEAALEITESGDYKIKFGDGVKTFTDLPYATMTPDEITSLITSGAVQTVTLASGTNNGTLKLTVDGKATDNIAVKGLGSAAHTNSSAYATSGHGHNISGVSGLQSALDGKANSSHTHDDRYYTESEMNTKLAAKANSSHTHKSADITSLDASKITGTIGIEHLPAGALERCVIVADDTARFALTTAKVQQGDTVKVTSTGKMYFVMDDSKLSTEAGYEIYTAGSATSVPWSGVTGKPTTFTPSSHKHTKSEITDFPTSMPASDVYGWAKASTKPSYTKSEVGLGNVDNTADSAKSVKYAASAGTASNVSATAADTASESFRHVWFSDAGSETKRAYNDTLKYDPKSNTITTNINGNAATASSVNWSGIKNAPSTYTPSAHSHAIADITNLQSTLNGKATSAQGAKADSAVQSVKIGETEYKSGTTVTLPAYPTSLPASDVAAWAKASTKPSYTKAEVGLGNVDNTADSAKSVKYATSAGSCSGNAATATKLATARNISITGGATAAAVSFNGTANVSLNVTSVSTDVLQNGSNTLILNCGGAA